MKIAQRILFGRPGAIIPDDALSYLEEHELEPCLFRGVLYTHNGETVAHITQLPNGMYQADVGCWQGQRQNLRDAEQLLIELDLVLKLGIESIVAGPQRETEEPYGWDRVEGEWLVDADGNHVYCAEDEGEVI